MLNEKYIVTGCNYNKDCLDFDSRESAKSYYLDKVHKGFISSLPEPIFYECPERNDVFVLDFSTGPCGLKAYGAESLIANCKKDVFGYAAPRVGHASEAIAYLCQQYNKKAVFFSAASKQASNHQKVVLAYKGSELRFVRIAAMPNLNRGIKSWCSRFNYEFLPFGLSNTKQVTACLVDLANTHSIYYGEPKEFWCAVSTGTMVRAFQIGWPNAKSFGVAVARNIKEGEKGEADVVSYHKTFYQSATIKPKIETTMTYDAKAYEYFLDGAEPGAVFINVGSDKQIENRLKYLKNTENIKSFREWGDNSDFLYDIGYGVKHEHYFNMFER